MIRFFFLLILFLGFLPLCSQNRKVKTTFPATFVRVSGSALLDEDGVYLIGGVNEEGQMRLLSSKLKSNKKIAASAAFEGEGDRIRVETDDCLWQLKRVGGLVWRLRSVQTGKYLARVSDKLGLQWLSNADKKTEWELEETGQGTFICAEAGQDQRSLSVTKEMEGKNSNFDNYSRVTYKSDDLYIYRLSGSQSGNFGQATMPDPGARVALAADGQMFLSSGRISPTADALLWDGTLAHVDGLGVWVAGVLDSHTLTLKSDAGYLNYRLQTSAEPSVWQIKDGRICTQETVLRYLSLDPATQMWQLSENAEEGEPVYFLSVADAPLRKVNTQGVCTLQGGWTASALADLPWEGVRCLDLTQAVLPQQPRAFNHTAETRNLPVFVSEEMVGAVPASWTFVVRCGARNELLRQTVFHDRESFYADRTIYAGEGMLTYERTGCTPQQWQTVALPYGATVKTGEAYKLVEARSDTLLFEETAQLVAGTGYLVLPDASGVLKIVSAGGNLQSAAPVSGTFRGVYSPWLVDASVTGIRFLTPDGKAFSLVAAGSKLAPFRAFLELSGSSRQRVWLKRQ